MKLIRKANRINPDAVMLKGRLAIRSDFREMMEGEANLWGISCAEYTKKLFEHFFCELEPVERHDIVNPSAYREEDFEDEDILL